MKMIFMDNFLRKLSSEEFIKLDAIRAQWDMAEQEFIGKLDDWFGNFNSEGDKRLAMKVVENIQYFSETAFSKQLTNLYQPIGRYLQEAGKSNSDLLILLPAERADSADKHAYHITKEWKLPQSCAITLDKIHTESVTKNHILVAFNDTHGTGNQFIFDIWEKLKELEIRLGEIPVLFIVAVTISEKARDFFKYSFANHRVTIVPEITANTAPDIFTANEFSRLEELCSRVYPSHRMGFGNTALLTAYYFQCPNNSLPIIWADGNNNKVGGTAYLWKPLFAYQPKTKVVKSEMVAAKQDQPAFKNTSTLTLDAADEGRINTILANWGCENEILQRHIAHINEWLSNFTNDQKDTALTILTQIKYLNLLRVRELISKLGKQVLSEVRSRGGDKSDVILVLTGYDQPSVYHHVFDFLKFWDLKISQAITLEELNDKKYIALNKTLVYFYHTRMNNNRHFIDKVWPKLKTLPAKDNFVLSFAMSEEADLELGKLDGQKIKRFFEEEISRTADSLFTEEVLNKMQSIYENKTGHQIEAIEKQLLVAYYFTCPKATLPLLGNSDTGWTPLFG